MKHESKINSKVKITLWLIIILGFIFRVIGLNWDQGQHLHPDERFLTMVLNDIKIPQKFTQYFDPATSTLNPYNQGYSFYVYGSFPLNLTKSLGVILHQDTYDQIYLVGRVITILLDTSIILLIFLICSQIFDIKTALFSSFLYATCVLPIQLSHFFTVDPFLNFFIFLSFYFLVKLHQPQNRFLNTVCLSASMALSLASKISAAYFLPVIFLFFILNFKKDFKSFLKYGFVFAFLTIILFRFCQPQTFSSGNYLNWQINPQFINNLKELTSWDKNPAYPPAIQWLKTIPLWFPFKNIFLWGLGAPLGTIFVLSLIFNLKNIFQHKFKKPLFLITIIFWILFLFFYQGSQSVFTMRYFLPIYPFICLISGVFLKDVLTRFNKPFILATFVFISLVYPIMFSHIFTESHTRVEASKWIYQNIPAGSTIATEYWDDALPLSLEDSTSSDYQIIELHVADLESDTKFKTLNSQIDQTDYIILSSNRFYKPIPQNSDIFPQTTQYYQSLFDGSLGFHKIAEFSSYPCLFNFCLNDDSSEEAFTVYDHPKVIIFGKDSL